MNEITYTFFDTQIGTVYVAAGPRGICRLTVGDMGGDEFARELREMFGAEAVRDDALVAGLMRDFRFYLRGSAVAWDWDVDLSHMTEFQRSVLRVVRRIPHGETMTYGDIAKRLGKGGHGARAVGQALGANTVVIIIP
jgi:O6-methylguanine-DNA--protein-cysteine methyltransferase